MLRNPSLYGIRSSALILFAFMLLLRVLMAAHYASGEEHVVPDEQIYSGVFPPGEPMNLSIVTAFTHLAGNARLNLMVLNALFSTLCIFPLSRLLGLKGELLAVFWVPFWAYPALAMLEAPFAFACLACMAYNLPALVSLAVKPLGLAFTAWNFLVKRAPFFLLPFAVLAVAISPPLALKSFALLGIASMGLWLSSFEAATMGAVFAFFVCFSGIPPNFLFARWFDVPVLAAFVYARKLEAIPVAAALLIPAAQFLMVNNFDCGSAWLESSLWWAYAFC